MNTRYFVDIGLPYNTAESTHVLRIESNHPISRETCDALCEADIVTASVSTLQDYRSAANV